MRGAAFLSGVRDGIVVDIRRHHDGRGGTDQRLSPGADAACGRRRRAHQLPDAGWSSPWDWAAAVSSGSSPRSPSGRTRSASGLRRRRGCSAARRSTATDIVVAAGLEDIGDRSQVASAGPEADRPGAATHESNRGRRDRPGEDPGGRCTHRAGRRGARSLRANELQGAERVVVPEHSAEANAIGAAMAQVGGVVDKVYSYRDRSREVSINQGEDRCGPAGG